MSEKRFILKRSNALSSNYRLGERVYDTVLKKELYNLEVVDLLNEQQATINKLKKARDESDKFIIKKGLEAEFLNWVVENDE